MVTYARLSKKDSKKISYKVSLLQAVKSFVPQDNPYFAFDGTSVKSFNDFSGRSFSQPVLGVIGSNCFGLFFASRDGVYFKTGDDLHQALSCAIATPQDYSYLFYRDSLIISVKNYGTYAMQKGNATKLCNHYFTSLAVCNERVWGVVDNKLVFSEVGNGSFDNEHFVTLPSYGASVVGKNNDLYVLASDVIYKVASSFDEKDMRLQQFAVGCGQVLPKSVVLVKDKVIFATKQGLYRIDGNCAKQIATYLMGKVQWQSVYACRFRNDYAFICALSDGQRAVVALDVSLDVPTVVCLRNGETICVDDDNLCVACNNFIYQSNHTPKINFCVNDVFDGDTCNKRLCGVSLLCPLGVNVRVVGKATNDYLLPPSPKKQSARIFGEEKSFCVNFFAQTPTSVSDVTFFALINKEVK